MNWDKKEGVGETKGCRGKKIRSGAAYGIEERKLKKRRDRFKGAILSCAERRTRSRDGEGKRARGG